MSKIHAKKVVVFHIDNEYIKKYAFAEILIGIGLCSFSSMWRLPAYISIAVGMSIIMLGVSRVLKYLEMEKKKMNLNAPNLFSVTFDKIKSLKSANKKNKSLLKDGMYLGKGFLWDSEHTQLYHQLKSLPYLREFVSLDSKTGGKPFMHNLGKAHEKEEIIELMGHTLLAGATGVGKTRLGELMLAQLINDGDAIIIIDPKGDKDLLDTIYRICIATGRENDFRFFSLSHPSRSQTFNPFTNYVKAGDIASRITSIMPQDGSSRPFVDFCWKVLVTVADVLVNMGETVSLEALHTFSLLRMEQLLSRAMIFTAQLPDGDQKKVLISSIERLELLVNHNKEHFSKMITSLEPVMTALATGEVGKILSPETASLTWGDIINKKRVVYFSLASMIDAFTSSAVGKLIIQDLISYVGQAYAFASGGCPLKCFIDEFYSVVYPGYVDMLNKSRGAGIQIYLLLQTTADITVATEFAMTKQILGNVDNKCFLRVPEMELAQEFCSLFGTVKIPKRSITRSVSADPQSDKELFSSGMAERIEYEDVDLISPEMIMSLPIGQAFLFTRGLPPVKIRIPKLSIEGLPEISYFQDILNPTANIGKNLKSMTAELDPADEYEFNKL